MFQAVMATYLDAFICVVVHYGIDEVTRKDEKEGERWIIAGKEKSKWLWQCEPYATMDQQWVRCTLTFN